LELKASQRHLKTTYPMLGKGVGESNSVSRKQTTVSLLLLFLQRKDKEFKMFSPCRPQNWRRAMCQPFYDLVSGGWFIEVCLYRDLKTTAVAVCTSLTVEVLHTHKYLNPLQTNINVSYISRFIPYRGHNFRPFSNVIYFLSYSHLDFCLPCKNFPIKFMFWTFCGIPLSFLKYATASLFCCLLYPNIFSRLV
jgi:hypothetical protein